MISHLKENGIINWYSFLIHGEKGDPNLYFHVRFNLRKDVKDREEVNNFLPDYCEKGKTARCRDVENIENIKGINKFILKNNEIEEAWRILGEQSEWLINMLNIHWENVVIPITQVGQFLHFYLNMTQLQFECPHCRQAFHSGDVIILI